MKKLLTFLALSFLLILALPTPALAQEMGRAIGEIFVSSIAFVTICIALASSLFIYFSSSKMVLIITFIVNAILLILYAKHFKGIDSLLFRPDLWDIVSSMSIVWFSANLFVIIIKMFSLIKTSSFMKTSPLIEMSPLTFATIITAIVVCLILFVTTTKKRSVAIQEGTGPIFVNYVKSLRFTQIQQNWPDLYAKAIKGNNLEAIRVLVQRNAQEGHPFIQKWLYDAVDNAPYDAIHYAPDDVSSDILLNSIRILLEGGADVNDKDNAGVLLLAAHLGFRHQILKIFLDAGADVNYQDKDGNTALIFVSDDSIDKIKLLIEAGADVNIKNKYGRNALNIISRIADETETLKLLLEKGIDLNVKDSLEKTALDYLKIRGYSETSEQVKLLRSYGAKTAEELKLDSVKETPSIEELNTPDQFWETLLLKAVKKGQTEEVKNLIAKGADVNFVDKYSESVLMSAVKKNQAEIAQLLIKSGANVNYKDKYGRSILQTAEQKGFTEIIELLKSAGAKE